MKPGSRPARIRALLGAELLALRRDTVTTLSLFVMVLAIGALAHIGALLPSDEADDGDDRPPAAWDCQPDQAGAVAAIGAVPAWLRWPDPLVAVDEAQVLLRFGPEDLPDQRQQIDIVALHEDARLAHVSRCLRSRRATERRRRLDRLGITEAVGGLARAELHMATTGAGLAAAGPTSAPLGAALATGLFMLLVSLYLELGPRSRASGWVEAWLSLPGHRSDLVWAWWIIGVLAGTLGVAVALVGHAIGGALSGLPAEPLPWLTVPPLVLLVAALGVRTFLDVEDMRTAITRSMPVIFSVMILAGVALAVEAKWPGLSGLVPVAGLGLAMAGRTTDAGTALAIATSLATTGLLLASCVHALEALPGRLGAMSRTAARRAAGDYRPEVVLLFLVAMAGSSTWAPAPRLNSDLVLATAVSMLAFVLAPALLVAGPLDLHRPTLLSWRAPPRRAWALLPFVVAGTLSLATLLWQAAVAVVPGNDLVDAYGQAMSAFRSPLGLVVISVVPGICEELLFRGAILGLLRRSMATWEAVLLQAALFALLHGLAVRLPYTFALGLVFGLLVVRTRSIWPAIAAHTLHNLLAAHLADAPADAASPILWVAAAAGLVAAWASRSEVRKPA